MCRIIGLVTAETQQMAAAVMAVAVGLEPTPRQQLERELKAILRLNSALAAMQAGVPVDFAAMLENAPPPTENPVGIVELWNKAKEKVSV